MGLILRLWSSSLKTIVSCFGGEVAIIMFDYFTHSSAVSVGFNPVRYDVLEGNPVNLTIVRVGDAEDPVVVTVSTSDGTATGILY